MMARGVCVRDRAMAARLRPFLLKAMNDADSGTRRFASRALSMASAGKDIGSVALLLSDADPFVRAFALEQLRLNGDASFTRMVAPLVDDADATVALAAVSCLAKTHRLDFGARGNRSAAENLAAFEACREWIKLHGSEFPPLPALPEPSTPEPVLAPTLSAETIEGRRFDLRSLRGKVAIVHFWHSRLKGAKEQLLALAEIERLSEGRVALVSVPVDAAPAEHAHKHEDSSRSECSHSGHHRDDEEQVESEEMLHGHSPVEARKDIEEFCRKNSVAGVILVDNGGLSVAYAVNDLPTTVMIDQDGYVRRRLVDARPMVALEAMLKEMGK